MKKGTVVLVVALLLYAAAALASPTGLDSSFGTGGVVTYNGGADTVATGMALQPDGKIVVVGTIVNGADSSLFVRRYTSGGAPDTSFGSGGNVYFTRRPFDGINGANAVALQPDGKILVAGFVQNTTRTPADFDFLVLRFNPNGTVDYNFGGGSGIATFDAGANERAYAIALHTDGKIVVAGNAGDRSDILVTRFDAVGTIDTTFGASGAVRYNGGGDDYTGGVAVQTDGKVIVAGTSQKVAYTDAVLIRFTASGALDTSFGGIGVVFYDGGNFDGANAVRLQPDGKILAAGFTRNATDYDAVLLRYNPDGTPDASFGTNGAATYNSGSDDYATSLALLPNGKILVAGYTGASANILVLKFNSNGTPDISFTASNVYTYNGSANSDDRAAAIVAQPDGRILVAGATSNGANRDVIILRLTQTLSANYHVWLPLVPRFSQYSWDSVIVISNFNYNPIMVRVDLTRFEGGAITVFETLAGYEKKAMGLGYFGLSGDVLTDIYLTSDSVFAAFALLMDLHSGKVQTSLPWFSNIN